eukprot:scaffold1246_cov449-Pavlova_lutheri.AAC.1
MISKSSRWAIQATGKALPHIRCRAASITFKAAVSPTSMPVSLSFSDIFNGRAVPWQSYTQVALLRSLCELTDAIKVGHFWIGCLRESVGGEAPSSRHSAQ